MLTLHLWTNFCQMDLFGVRSQQWSRLGTGTAVLAGHLAVWQTHPSCRSGERIKGSRSSGVEEIPYSPCVCGRERSPVPWVSVAAAGKTDRSTDGAATHLNSGQFVTAEELCYPLQPREHRLSTAQGPPWCPWPVSCGDLRAAVVCAVASVGQSALLRAWACEAEHAAGQHPVAQLHCPVLHAVDSLSLTLLALCHCTVVRCAASVCSISYTFPSRF